MQLQFYTLVIYHYPHLSFSLGHSCILALVMKPLTETTELFLLHI